MNMFSVFWDYRTYFATGIQYTLLLAAIGVICGFVLGIIISLMRMSRFWLPKMIGSVWVEVLRGTPMVVQLFIIHYGLVAFKSVLPAIGNEFITIIKESSIVSFIGVTDLMYQSGAIQGITYDYLSPLLVIAAIYFIMTFTLSKLLGAFERRLNTDDQR
ncbi:ABC transporter permease subunit [Paenibacillus sp. AR247]|uniref:ABC transporter permease subunit n=1 Tax=Paenibacillus sp. AR247 TaxID=1631599 RepID=UPI000CF9D4E1|nr:ABC transporter permease subunit [Paenibacillus sp. AR247]PQP90548.1 hypothetical protein CPT76_06170 [Paenibacillus sp. AR247]